MPYSHGDVDARVDAQLAQLEDALEDGYVNGLDDKEKRAFKPVLQRLRALAQEFRGPANDPEAGVNDPLTLIQASAVTSDQTSATQDNTGARGLVLIFEVTAIGTQGGVTPSVQRQDRDGNWSDWFTLTQLTANDTIVAVADPNVGAAAGLFDDVKDAALPKDWRVNAVLADGNAVDFEVSGFYIR